MKQLCFASNPLHPIVAADVSADIREVFRKVWEKAHKAKNVVEYMKDKPQRTS
jgi:hypothetical protein